MVSAGGDYAEPALHRQAGLGIGRAQGEGVLEAGRVVRNSVAVWEVSEKLSHEPLVDDTTFIAVHQIRATQQTKDGEQRHYSLAGLTLWAV